jgi:hypothetical protein
MTDDRLLSLRPGADEFAPWYAGYVARVPDGDVLHALRTGIDETEQLLSGLTEAQAAFRYAPGKWSVRQVVGHLCDSERVFSYRALRFARNDPTELAGYNENLFAAEAGSDQRSLASLTVELREIRLATVSLLDALPDQAWSRRGVANGAPVTVRAIAWIIAGHERHHVNVIQTRYL